MKAESKNEEILYFEDLEPNIQDAIIDFIVSIIENKYRDKAEAVQGSETSTKRQKEKVLPSKKRLPAM
jgi:hypothetical protein